MAARRLFIPGLSHHVYHRGNNRSVVFRDDADRIVFLELLGRACARLDVALHTYALMDTHYHLQVTSPDALALPRTMQSLGRSYVRYFNDKYTRTGTLWEGRYHAALIADERRWLTCMRYIELNPVEAHMVKTPEKFRWSSYRHHATGKRDDLITPHPLFLALGPTPERRMKEWCRLCGHPVPSEEAALITRALDTNSLLHGPGKMKLPDSRRKEPDESPNIEPIRIHSPRRQETNAEGALRRRQ